MNTSIEAQTPAAIAAIETAAEAAYISRMANAASVFYAARGDRETAQQTKEIYIRSARRAGKLLLDIPRENGGRPKNSLRQKSVYVISTSYQQQMDSAGISPFVAHVWQKLAEIPDEKIEIYLAEAKYAQTEYTINGLLNFANGKRIIPHTLDSAINIILHWLKIALEEWPDEAPEILRAVIEREIG